MTDFLTNEYIAASLIVNKLYLLILNIQTVLFGRHTDSTFTCTCKCNIHVHVHVDMYMYMSTSHLGGYGESFLEDKELFNLLSLVLEDRQFGGCA